MSDAQTQQEASAATAPGNPRSRRPRKLPGGRWMWVVLLILLIGVGIQQLMAVRFWETLDNEAGQIATVDGRLTALEAAMADQTRLREDVQQMQDALLQERSLLALERFEQQLDAGWQSWISTGDTSMLLNAMQSIQRRLANQPGAAAQALRLAVGRDLVAIKSQRTLDLRAAVQNLDAVIATLDKLPLIQEGRVPTAPNAKQPASPDVPTSAEWLERARQFALALGQDIWNAVRSMVRVQRLDRAEPGLIAPEQKVFLQQGLRLLLLDARHALIMRNTVTYQQTLSQARAWILKYADSTDALVKSDLDTLHQLATLNIDSQAISLEDTLQALSAARSALTGESAADDDAPVAANANAAVAPVKEGNGNTAPAKEAAQ